MSVKTLHIIIWVPFEFYKMNYNANVGARNRKLLNIPFRCHNLYLVVTIVPASRKPKRVSDVNAMGYPQAAYPPSQYGSEPTVPVAPSTPYNGGMLPILLFLN